MAIHYYTPEEVKKIREAGRILARVAKEVLVAAAEGAILRQLDALARQLIRKAGAQPAFLGYRPGGAKKPYPAAICTSVNEVVVHGIPSDYALKPGDLLKLDFGVIYNGYYADAAWTVPIGVVSPEAGRLIDVTKKALYKGIAAATTDKTLGDIGYAVQNCVEKAGFHVITGLTGHGVGKALHEDPSVYNFGEIGKGMPLAAGLVLAIEPMTAIGSGNIVKRPDESYATADGSLSVHFEHTIAITEYGPVILTKE